MKNKTNGREIVVFVIHLKIVENVKTKRSEHSKILTVSESKQQTHDAQTPFLCLFYMYEISKMDA